ncbi:MAG: hypothetical protein ABL966_06540, partial [Acidimicrobiales bacterium]
MDPDAGGRHTEGGEPEGIPQRRGRHRPQQHRAEDRAVEVKEAGRGARDHGEGRRLDVRDAGRGDGAHDGGHERMLTKATQPSAVGSDDPHRAKQPEDRAEGQPDVDRPPRTRVQHDRGDLAVSEDRGMEGDQGHEHQSGEGHGDAGAPKGDAQRPLMLSDHAARHMAIVASPRRSSQGVGCPSHGGAGTTPGYWVAGFSGAGVSDRMLAMSGIGLMIRAGIRGRWRVLAALALLTALSCGFALTAATGARRTATSWDRLNDRTFAPDALAEVANDALAEGRATIASRPDVAGVGAFSYLPARIADNPAVEDLGMFAGYGPGFGTEVLRPLIDEGRLFNPERDDELLINRAYADLAGVGVGDRVHLAGPAGISQDATIVGIERSSLEIGPNGGQPGALGTPAFTARWLPALKELAGFDVVRPVIAMRFVDGTDVASALTELQADLPDQSTIIDADMLEGDIRDGVAAGSNGYWLLTVASGFGSVLLLTFLATRTLRAGPTDVRLLAAFGTTRGSRAAALWAPVAIALVVGCATAPIVATLASPLVRTGFARVADPQAGIWVEPASLAACA